MWCEVADRARSKPREFCEGTRYCWTTVDLLCRGRCEVLWMGIAVSLVTFFAAAKKVTAAPHRGSANRPTRIRDPAKLKALKRVMNPRKHDNLIRRTRHTRRKERRLRTPRRMLIKRIHIKLRRLRQHIDIADFKLRPAPARKGRRRRAPGDPVPRHRLESQPRIV